MTLIKNFNVGPSSLFPGVAEYLKQSIDSGRLIIPHRSPEFSHICKTTDQAMRDFFEIPEEYKIFYTYSATEGMEIVLRSIDDVTFINNGDFWDLFVSVGSALSKNYTIIKKDRGERVELIDMIVSHNSLLLTANDTSTWIEYSPSELQNIRKKFSHHTIIVDGTSSFGARNYDIRSADGWIFSVQKNLWLPPGLGVLVVNEKIIDMALKKEQQDNDTWGHHRISQLIEFQKNYHTPSTPNILLIDALWFIALEYKKVFKSISHLEQITQKKSELFYHLIEKNTDYRPLHNWVGRSQTTFVLETPNWDSTQLIAQIKNMWYSVSPGYGAFKKQQFRIANFPVHSTIDIKKLVEILKSNSQKYKK